MKQEAILGTDELAIVVSAPRDDKGKFIKGQKYSPATQFKKGQHWREPQLYWNKDWLYSEYVIKKRTTPEIAAQFHCLATNIQFFLKKFGIPRRNISDTRAIKHWGCSGRLNPMYGKYGELNPRWDGGHSPERQTMYARAMWKELKKTILKRDNYRCQDCGGVNTTNNGLVVHHIKAWARHPDLRFEPTNLVTLCERCHKLRHKPIARVLSN